MSKSNVELTINEKRAIESLKALARRWPKSLWLFSASGTLCVMKKNTMGKRVYLDSDGTDPDYKVDTIQGIDNDGGDW
jgi:hypothetical protein